MTKNNERPLINVVSQGAPVLSFTRGYSLKGCGDVVCFCVGLESYYCEFITAAMPNAEPPRVYLYAPQ